MLSSFVLCKPRKFEVPGTVLPRKFEVALPIADGTVLIIGGNIHVPIIK